MENGNAINKRTQSVVMQAGLDDPNLEGPAAPAYDRRRSSSDKASDNSAEASSSNATSMQTETNSRIGVSRRQTVIAINPRSLEGRSLDEYHFGASTAANRYLTTIAYAARGYEYFFEPMPTAPRSAGPIVEIAQAFERLRLSEKLKSNEPVEEPEIKYIFERLTLSQQPQPMADFDNSQRFRRLAVRVRRHSPAMSTSNGPVEPVTWKSIRCQSGPLGYLLNFEENGPHLVEEIIFLFWAELNVDDERKLIQQDIEERRSRCIRMIEEKLGKENSKEVVDRMIQDFDNMLREEGMIRVERGG
jgi:hypothetical protein